MIPATIQDEAREMMVEWVDNNVPEEVDPSYMFGPWLEAEFNGKRGLELDWRELHDLARYFLEQFNAP